MAVRRVIVLSCDECGAQPHRRFRTLAELDAWIRQSGWREIYYRDWCPRCLAADTSTT